MRKFVLAAFAALTLITTMVPVAFAAPYDSTRGGPPVNCGLCGGGN